MATHGNFCFEVLYHSCFVVSLVHFSVTVVQWGNCFPQSHWVLEEVLDFSAPACCSKGNLVAAGFR